MFCLPPMSTTSVSESSGKKYPHIAMARGGRERVGRWRREHCTDVGHGHGADGVPWHDSCAPEGYLEAKWVRRRRVSGPASSSVRQNAVVDNLNLDKNGDLHFRNKLIWLDY